MCKEYSSARLYSHFYNSTSVQSWIGETVRMQDENKREYAVAGGGERGEGAGGGGDERSTWFCTYGEMEASKTTSAYTLDAGKSAAGQLNRVSRMQ